MRRGQPGDQVGGAGTGGGHADAYLSRGLCVPIRCVSSALLMTAEDVLDRRVDQRVVCRKDCAPGDAENVLHPHRLERLEEGLCPGDLAHVPISLLNSYNLLVARGRSPKQSAPYAESPTSDSSGREPSTFRETKNLSIIVERFCSAAGSFRRALPQYEY